MLMATTACPYCGVEMEVPSENVMRSTTELTKDNALGAKTFVMLVEICPNLRCRGVRAALSMYPMREDNRGTLRIVLEPEREWQLIPIGARALPDYVPAPVRREYEEASAVRVVSPNAAATLARRCLQLMIRDFWGITKGMLSAEIDALKEKVEPETWGAIESVRRNGQIGAHLDKGANLIQEADPHEPDVLLSLIEYLIEDWYVARHKRQERLSALRETAPVLSARPPVPKRG
jgi:hypothetical protein